MFPPPVYHGELEKWEDWSWQLKRYVGLHKPLAKLLMDDAEGSLMMTCARRSMSNRRARRMIRFHCFRGNWLTCWRKSLMALRERFFAGDDCANSLHCLRERNPRLF